MNMKKKEIDKPILPRTVLILYAHPEPNSWAGIVKERVEDSLYLIWNK